MMQRISDAMRRAAVPLFCVAFLFASPATSAQQAVPTTATGSESPVTISRMFTEQAPKRHYEWASCVSFTNASNRSIRAIQFQFTYYDAFDTPITTFRGDRVGDFAPGVLIEGPENADIVGGGNVDQKVQNCWVIGQLVGSLEKVTAEVLKVRFANGDIWVAPPDHAVFTATYMGGGGGSFVEPPATLRCRMGILGVITVHWDAMNQDIAKRNARIVACVKDWERDNGDIRGWPTPDPSPSPTSVPSESPKPR